MFDFLRRTPKPELSAAMRKALVDDRLPDGIDPDKLNVVQRRGSYSGRSVSYFRVFDPTATAATGIHPRAFEDLDSHANLIVGSGHVEAGGAVVLKPRTVAHANPTPARLLADRGVHSDDDRVMFPGGAPPA